jgi:hypothetical protein
MKPTAQLTHLHGRTTLPLIDYGFQSPTNPSARTETGTHDSRKVWKLGTDYFAGEAMRESKTEVIAFVAIGLLAAWPVLFALHWIARVIGGY